MEENSQDTENGFQKQVSIRNLTRLAVTLNANWGKKLPFLGLVQLQTIAMERRWLIWPFLNRQHEFLYEFTRTYYEDHFPQSILPLFIELDTTKKIP